ncbi:MAG TPA: carboxypeptidase-like regulatory domain-containing protein [Chthoniobacterales bacterium]|nr:carboxypeptidase-like regulatory domain-containing protein [Chthoniobacterales bacterium]
MLVKVTLICALGKQSGSILLVLVVVLITAARLARDYGKRADKLPKDAPSPTTPTTSLAPSALTPASSVLAPQADVLQEERFRAAFSTPISFYGRVTDQNGIPVSDADVKIAANDKAFGGRPSEYSMKSDSNGLFSITGLKGIMLAVEVAKAGYHVLPPADDKVTSSGVFDYGVSSIRGPHRPDPANPVHFTLIKRGAVEALAKIDRRDFRIQRDGSPVAISLDLHGQHQVVLRCWNEELHRPAARRQYDWRLEIAVPGGGLVARIDAFAFEAPADGYLPIDTITMPASLGDRWRSSADRSYFIHFDDDTFALATLEMHASGGHFVVWESYFNPKPGSRNLEPTPR